MQDPKVSLKTLGSGAAMELFDAELQRVLDNIVDINTPANKTRKIVLEVAIKPDIDREWGQVTIQAKSTLAPNEAYSTKFILGKSQGRGFAEEYAPKQMTLDENKVVPLTGKEKQQ